MRRVRKATTAHQMPTAEVPLPIDDCTVMLSMIQALIPLGLKAVEEALQRDVTALAGARYAHDDGTPGMARWGQQRGSIYLADQKIPITVPRVRDLQADRELPLAIYAQLQTPRARRVPVSPRAPGVSTREYEAAAKAVPEAFGIAKSTPRRPPKIPHLWPPQTPPPGVTV